MKAVIPGLSQTQTEAARNAPLVILARPAWTNKTSALIDTFVEEALIDGRQVVRFDEMRVTFGKSLGLAGKSRTDAEIDLLSRHLQPNALIVFGEIRTGTDTEIISSCLRNQRPVSVVCEVSGTTADIAVGNIVYLSAEHERVKQQQAEGRQDDQESTKLFSGEGVFGRSVQIVGLAALIPGAVVIRLWPSTITLKILGVFRCFAPRQPYLAHLEPICDDVCDGKKSKTNIAISWMKSIVRFLSQTEAIPRVY